jgi:hypothetical protein
VSGTVGTERHRHRERLAGFGEREVAEVERAATVGQPAHDDLAPADHLLAVDAQVLALARIGRALRATRDDQPPRDQGAGVIGPAGLNRQCAEVDVGAVEDLLLARRVANAGGLHVPQRLRHV